MWISLGTATFAGDNGNGPHLQSDGHDWLHPAIVLDLFSRKIVGWSVIGWPSIIRKKGRDQVLLASQFV